MMPRHVLDDSERLFLEMARLEQAGIQGGMRGGGMTAADLAEAAAEAHQERGEAGEADATDDQEEEFIRDQIARHEHDAETDSRAREAAEFFRSELGKLLRDRLRHKSDPDAIDPPGWKEPREPGGEDAEAAPEPSLYYDAQTGQVTEALYAPDTRRWYRLVENWREAMVAFEEEEPALIGPQDEPVDIRGMEPAERDALMGRLHWEQYGRPGAPLLEPLERLQRAQGWRSSAAPRPAWLASASRTSVAPRLGGQPGLPTFTERPFVPRPAEQDPLLEGLKEPLFPLAGATRMIPQSVTDVEGLDRQLEPDRLDAGSWWPEAPKPNELLTPRTRDILDELERQERMDLPEPTEMAGLVPLGEYLRRLAG